MFVDNQSLSVSGYWLAFWTKYRSAIISKMYSWFKDENIDDTSCKQYGINQYYYAFYLGLLIKNELYEGIHQDEEYYNNKYDLVRIRKNLACNGINLNDIFTIFSITFSNIEPIIIRPNTEIYCEGIFVCDPYIIVPGEGCTHCSS